MRKGLLLCSTLLCSTPAMAGEDVRYEPAPTWIAPATLPAPRPGPPLVLYDDQRRIEDGRLWSYVDRAIRVDNPQMVTGAGTLQAQWLPDKGDLIVHRVSILRGGQEVDVLAGGARFEILRRELQLEQRVVDGSLTATLAVPGLRVGDVLRVSYSVTLSDQALDREVQTTAFLPAKPFEAGSARVRLSWPQGSDVRWRASRGIDLGQPVTADGFSTLEVKLPLAELPEMPGDAPVRYQMPGLLQASTFADWPEVSRVMAPLFATSGTVERGGPIAAEVARIRADNNGQLQQAVAALRVVQDQVSYFLNGMQGGNYIPQSPAETWDKRYGDCKAKALLLLAMLRELGIEAEAVVVASQTGDAVPVTLPQPGAFDHVIVRAVIAGKEYWLDGTSSGTSMAVVDEVPPFHVALPLRTAGADLLPMVQRPQGAFDSIATLTFDHRAGLDLPTLFDGKWVLTGTGAVPFRSVIGQASEEQLESFIQAFVGEQVGEAQVLDSNIAFDEASSTATVTVKGLMSSAWRFARGSGVRGFDLPSQNFSFTPDRTRAAWRDIPVALPGPVSQRSEFTVLLPDAPGPYTLEGRSAFTAEIAHVRLSRQTKLSDQQLTIAETSAWPGGEVAAADIAAERQKAARLGDVSLSLRAPAGAPRRFDIGPAQGRARFAQLDDAYARLIAADPDDANNFRNRARFRSMTWDWAGAIEDTGKVIELEPTAADYLARAYLFLETGRMKDALADADTAWELNPSVESAFARAGILPYLDRVDEAIALLQEQAGTAEEKRTIGLEVSELEALAGRKEAGLERIEAYLAEQPNDPGLLNAKCWYLGIWNMVSDRLADVCTTAVEKAASPPPVLDSRAMAYYRLGRFQDALKDLETALAVNPELTPSLFMRGVVRRALGDNAGERDIAAALARQPSLERTYGRYGIKAR
ncbi:MAG: DUF3857 domain-containing protein [Croceibacterium sp.]